MMLGHSDLEATTVYLHLSRRHLQSTANPLEQISDLEPRASPHSPGDCVNRNEPACRGGGRSTPQAGRPLHTARAPG